MLPYAIPIACSVVSGLLRGEPAIQAIIKAHVFVYESARMVCHLGPRVLCCNCIDRTNQTVTRRERRRER